MGERVLGQEGMIQIGSVRHHGDFSHLELLGVLGDRAVSVWWGSREQHASGAGSGDDGSPHERVIRGDKAEAPRGDLMNPLGVEAARKKNKGERKPIGSSRA